MTQSIINTPRVSVAVSAYNEEESIAAFLRSVLSQKEDGFVIDRILVISDGSTDQTVARVKSLGHPKIEIVKYEERLGKSSRLNQIYTTVDCDILVQSDADVVWPAPTVLYDLIQPILNDSNVGMCGGRPLPLIPSTFTEKAVNATAAVYDSFRPMVRGGDNVFSADGRLLAYRKELYKKMTIPHDMIANDMFTYFLCLTNSYKYKYVAQAIVNFRSPQTMKDQIRQNTRFLSARSRMERYFGSEMVSRELRIPKMLYIGALLKQFVRHPVLSSYIFLINRYCQIKSSLVQKKLTAQWEIAETTKSLY